MPWVVLSALLIFAGEDGETRPGDHGTSIMSDKDKLALFCQMPGNETKPPCQRQDG